MHLNYIILAHKNPKQLERLVCILNENWTSFYIHIDKQIDITPFLKIQEQFPNAYFLYEEERELGTWGDIAIVNGTLNAMRQVLKNGPDGYCILLSGQDYPLKSNFEIRDFLEKHKGQNFISIYQTPTSWVEPYKERITKYKINKSLKRGHFLFLPTIFDSDFYRFETLGKMNYLRKSGRLNKLKLIFKKRKFPSAIAPYGGGVYWALPTKTIAEILKFIEVHPDFLNFHKYTLCADEVFFHSIIMHLARDLKWEITPSLTYVNWERPGGPLPVTFEIGDLDELKGASQRFLWARKFDENIDTEILDKIDAKLLL